MMALALALALDAVFGWPNALYRRIGHPVTWLGALIAALDRRWNRADDTASARQRAGLLAALVVIGVATGTGAAVAAVLPDGPLGLFCTALLAAPLLAARSLHDHVAAVARPLAAGDLDAARQAVAAIVGRDPRRLDRPAIARAAIESLAENTSDGVIAPLFWAALFGLPGLAGYKAINTLDSMIGYRTPRHADFGRFAARLDDVANWVPARLTAALIALVSARPGLVLGRSARDARNHRSPNAGWPETAMAAAIGCRLSGPRIYDTGPEPAPWLNAEAPAPGADTMAEALRVFRHAVLLSGVLLVALGVIV